MNRFLAALFFLLLMPPAYAGDAVAARVTSSGDVVLSDGRLVHLAGVALWPQAMPFLRAAVAGHALDLQDVAADRYGRIAATVLVSDENQSLQEELLRRGLAFVYPARGDEPHLDDNLSDESAARKAGQGAWPQHPDTAASNAAKLYGSYGFVVGTVVKAERVKNKLYLNFGADWRDSFTIAIAARDRRVFRQSGVDPLQWQGKSLRVRGWVVRDGGPMITVTDPHQIEVFD